MHLICDMSLFMFMSMYQCTYTINNDGVYCVPCTVYFICGSSCNWPPDLTAGSFLRNLTSCHTTKCFDSSESGLTHTHTNTPCVLRTCFFSLLIWEANSLCKAVRCTLQWASLLTQYAHTYQSSDWARRDKLLSWQIKLLVADEKGNNWWWFFIDSLHRGF